MKPQMLMDLSGYPGERLLLLRILRPELKAVIAHELDRRVRMRMSRGERERTFSLSSVPKVA
jgi:hypothetical protein